MSTDPFAHLDAAYVLGALEADERADYEAHLAGCPACTSRVSELRPLPALLAGFTAGDFADGDQVPDTLWPGLLRRVTRERRRRRWLGAALAAATVASLLTLGFTLLPPSPQHQPPARAMTVLVSSPVQATIAFQAKPWGTEIDLACQYAATGGRPAGYTYTLVATDRSGTAQTLGTWTLVPGTTHYVSGTSLPQEQIKTVQIRLSTGAPILQWTN